MARTAINSLTPKVIERELEADERLYYQLSLAEALHCTLYQLKRIVTEEEMQLWACYFSIKAKRQKREMDKIKRGSGAR